MLKFIKQRPFIILASLLTIFELLYILKSRWSNDFWEHSAAVSELSRNLFHPSNPIINENVPHAFFSPYSLIVAVFTKITHLNSIQSLECFAFFNLVFFLSAFYLFCKSVFREKHQTVTTLSLLFILFFWGTDPPFWSGYYHIMVLNYVLPYPSTFAISLSFLILSKTISIQNKKSKLTQIALLVFLCAVVFITHPMSAVFLSTCIIAITFIFNNYSLKQCLVRSGIIILPSILISLLWPYFSVISLLSSSNPDFEYDSKTLYFGLFQRYWPVIFALPGAFIFIKEKSYNFLSVSLILMVLIVAAGWICCIYGVSRILSGIMLMAQISIACMVIFCISNHKILSKIYLILLSIAFSISIYLNGANLIRTLHFNGLWVEDYTKYTFLRNIISSNEVILSDESTNWYIPSFGGKVISSRHPLYWVNDLKDRRNATKVFFTAESSDSVRHTIIDKYKPSYILIDHSKVQLSNSTLEWLRKSGRDVYQNESMELIKINPDDMHLPKENTE